MKSTGGLAAKVHADRVMPRKRRSNKVLPPVQILFCRILREVAWGRKCFFDAETRRRGESAEKDEKRSQNLRTPRERRTLSKYGVATNSTR